MRLTLPIALLVCGCCNKEAPAKADRPAPVAVKTTEPLTPPEPVKLPAPKTLADAVERARPLMADSVNKPDPGAAALAGVWQEKSYTWAELSAVSETKIALVAKDSDAERGKRLCTAGAIVEIAKVQPGIFHGRIMNDAVEVSTFYSVGSTGTLVQKSSARFCGIVTGRHSYGNAAGGTTHSVMLVGMFDLPENKAKK